MREKKKARTIDELGALVFVAALVCLDQFSKWLAARCLKEDGPFVIWDGVFELRYLENRGMAFGLLQNQRIFFVLMTVLVVGVLAYLYHASPRSRRYLPLRLCILFLGAGAVGNWIDRLLHGYVTDFFYFSLIDFPIFNVADIYVTVTFFVLLLLVFFYYKEEELQVYWERLERGRRGERKE